jgi:RNA polymerase sigma-70 factor, ECF subfamily
MNAPKTGDSQITSLTLLGQAVAQDPTAWQRLVRLYSPAVFRWAKRTGLQDDDAADVVQDVWAGVSQALARFRHDPQTGTFRGWLWTITRNKTGDVFRRRQESAVAAGGSDAHQQLQNLPEVEPPDESAANSAGILQQALELIRPDFEERTWRAFWQLGVERRPAREVAEALGMAANAVHQAKFRILKRLREVLGELGVADDPSFAPLLASA